MLKNLIGNTIASQSIKKSLQAFFEAPLMLKLCDYLEEGELKEWGSIVTF